MIYQKRTETVPLSIYSLTNELEKTTRQLLDLEKSQAQKEASGRTRSTSTGGLEPEKDPAIEEGEQAFEDEIQISRTKGGYIIHTF